MGGVAWRVEVVTDSMMPEGVEHQKLFVIHAVRSDVTDSMMPEGVEHGCPGEGRSGTVSDRFHDAGRR